jgi:tRNA pseudouridine13 synthase
MEKSNKTPINNTPVPEIERSVGIETYFTTSKGFGGKLRTFPEDFSVREMSSYPQKNEKGEYILADVTSINWETNLLIREFSHRLHISRKRISFAGTKDKRSKATRLMSFFKVPRDRLEALQINNVIIENIYPSDRSIKIGDLQGNHFDVIIRDVETKTQDSDLQSIISPIDHIGGFPNFFGIQRFGVIRPITHVVGKALISADFENAVMTYIAHPIQGENPETYLLRKKLEEDQDFLSAFQSYPYHLNYEKAMLNSLITQPTDFISALKTLPKNLLTMFVYAYQSYLFNKILSMRIQKKLPLHQATIGDIIFPIRKGEIAETPIFVTEKNSEKVNTQLGKGKAVVTGILTGSNVPFAKGEMGEIEHTVIKNERIDLRDFIIPEIPFLSSYGSRRALLTPVKNLSFVRKKDTSTRGKLMVKISFELTKGCYATSLLREFMKSQDVTNY